MCLVGICTSGLTEVWIFGLPVQIWAPAYLSDIEPFPLVCIGVVCLSGVKPKYFVWAALMTCRRCFTKGEAWGLGSQSRLRSHDRIPRDILRYCIVFFRCFLASGSGFLVLHVAMTPLRICPEGFSHLLSSLWLLRSCIGSGIGVRTCSRSCNSLHWLWPLVLALALTLALAPGA